MNYQSFWIVMFLYTLLMLAGFHIAGFFGTFEFNGERINLPELNIHTFPGLWHYLTYLAGFFHYLPALLVIMLTVNDIQYGLWRQHIADGLSRGEVVGAKILTVAFITGYATFLVFITGLIYGLINTPGAGMAMALESAGFIAGFAIQAFAYMVLAFCFAVVVERMGLAIILMLFYTVIGERLLGFYLPGSISGFLPVASISGIISNPFASLIGIQVADTPFISNFYVSLIWIVFIIACTYLFMRWKDV